MTEETKYWESLKKGEITALKTLYDLHADTLYHYGMVLCRDADRVRDCMHDLFLMCWNNREKIAVPSSGKAYLMVSLRRRIFDKGPKSNLSTTSLEDLGELQGMSDDAQTGWIIAEEESEQQEMLGKAMQALSERQREIIHMKYYQRMEYEDIAAIMGLNYQSARNLVNRAIMALRKEMIPVVLIYWAYSEYISLIFTS